MSDRREPSDPEVSARVTEILGKIGIRPKKPAPDPDKIAKALGAGRRGKIPAKGGYFGALETAANRPPPRRKRRYRGKGRNDA